MLPPSDREKTAASVAAMGGSESAPETAIELRDENSDHAMSVRAAVRFVAKTKKTAGFAADWTAKNCGLNCEGYCGGSSRSKLADEKWCSR